MHSVNYDSVKKQGLAPIWGRELCHGSRSPTWNFRGVEAVHTAESMSLLRQHRASHNKACWMVARPRRASPVPIPFQEMAGTCHPCVSPGHSPGLLLTPAYGVVPAQAVPHPSAALPSSCPQSSPPPTWRWVSSPKGDTLEDRLLETVCLTDLPKHVRGAREGSASSPGISIPWHESFHLLQLASLYQLRTRAQKDHMHLRRQFRKQVKAIMECPKHA